MYEESCGLAGAARLSGWSSRAVNAENPKGEKGRGGMAAGALGASRKGSPCIPRIEPGETKVLADIRGAGILRHIWMTVTDQISEGNRYVFRDLVLRMYWDGEKEPSVECPLGDFFCCGFGRSYPVNSLPVVVIPRHGFNSYFTMPFASGARITLENQNEEAVPSFFYQMDYSCMDRLPAGLGYFHAQWRRSRITEKKKDHILLDGVNGKGQYIGTFLALSSLERYWWGEGEVKFYLDGDEEYPTICGTGTEDYFGGAWSFAGTGNGRGNGTGDGRGNERGNGTGNGRMEEQNYQTPFLGYPFYSRRDEGIYSDYHNDDCPPMRALYRFHIPDPVYFRENIKVAIQQIGCCHSGLFERQDDVSTVAYWYQTEPHTSFPALPERKERWPR